MILKVNLTNTSNVYPFDTFLNANHSYIFKFLVYLLVIRTKLCFWKARIATYIGTKLK